MNIKIRLWAVLFWLAAWQIASWTVGQAFLFAPPLNVFYALIKLVQDAGFYTAVSASVGRILLGFCVGLVLGIAAAVLSAASRRCRELLAPLVFTIKTIPVASFIILILVWASSRQLPAIISAIMVFPVIYTNVLAGITSCDSSLLEMASVFGMSRTKKALYIYLPEVMPHFRSGASLSLGLAWKAGVAAEVIGLPMHSIGENLYNSKIFLSMDELLAWTIVIIILSISFEKIFIKLIEVLMNLTEHSLCGKKPDFHSSDEHHNTHTGAAADKTSHAQAGADSWQNADENSNAHTGTGTDAGAQKHIQNRSQNQAAQNQAQQLVQTQRQAQKPEQTQNQAQKLAQNQEQTAICLSNISKSFESKPVLRDISLNILHGEHIVITGESGSGKTTLLRIIIGLEHADAASKRSVATTGCSVAAAFTAAEQNSNRAAEQRSLKPPKYAAVFQEDRLIESLSASANIRAVCEARGTDADHKIYSLLDSLGLADEYTTPVNRLSGGMKRRICILRALSHDADILIFDEPLRGMDSELKTKTQRLLQRYTKDKTVVYVTHDISEAAYLDNPKIYCLNDGTLSPAAD